MAHAERRDSSVAMNFYGEQDLKIYSHLHCALLQKRKYITLRIMEKLWRLEEKYIIVYWNEKSKQMEKRHYLLKAQQLIKV